MTAFRLDEEECSAASDSQGQRMLCGCLHNVFAAGASQGAFTDDDGPPGGISRPQKITKVVLIDLHKLDLHLSSLVLPGAALGAVAPASLQQLMASSDRAQAASITAGAESGGFAHPK